jgi:hypothetical protein
MQVHIRLMITLKVALADGPDKITARGTSTPVPSMLLTISSKVRAGSNPYSVIWKNDSNLGGLSGLHQSITVDAYFSATTAGPPDTIAQLRLRSGEHSGAAQPFWDTGYLASFQTNGLFIQDVFKNGNPYLGSYLYTGSQTNPFTSTGWYTLRFDVSGTSTTGTSLKVWVEDNLYLDILYTDADAANDSGYIGLGRLIQYDNARGFSTSEAPVPEPSTMILFGIGILGAAGIGRKKIAQ